MAFHSDMFSTLTRTSLLFCCLEMQLNHQQYDLHKDLIFKTYNFIFETTDFRVLSICKKRSSGSKEELIPSEGTAALLDK